MVITKGPSYLLCKFCVRQCTYLVQSLNGRNSTNPRRNCYGGHNRRFPRTDSRFYTTSESDDEDTSDLGSMSLYSKEQIDDKETRKLITLDTIMKGQFEVVDQPKMINKIGSLLMTFGDEKLTQKQNEKKKYAEFIKKQKYSTERVQILGPDLGAAHYILARAGACKLKDIDEWYTMDSLKTLPNVQVDGMFVEGIRATWTDLAFEGLVNFRDLQYLKFLDLSYCVNMDDFCLSLLKLITPTLEFLDISGCPYITHLGIPCLHQLPNLKKVRIADNPHFAHNKEVFAQLKEIRPDLEFFTDLKEDAEDLNEDQKDEDKRDEAQIRTSSYSPNVEWILNTNVNASDKVKVNASDKVNVNASDKVNVNIPDKGLESCEVNSDTVHNEEIRKDKATRDTNSISNSEICDTNMKHDPINQNR